MNQIDVIRLLTKAFYAFRIRKNRVVLTAYNGRQYGCSPKYIAEGLLKEENMFEIYFALNRNVGAELPQGIKRVNYKSLKHFYLLMTSKFVIFNSTGVSCLLPYRKSQVIINTWHGGGAFKKTGISLFKSKKDLKKRKISGENTSYFISSSKVFGVNQCYSMCLSSEKMLNIGTPRNDILFTDNAKIARKVFDFFGIDKKCGLILYAPTYRNSRKEAINDYTFDPINILMILEATKCRFGKQFVFLYRAHHDMMPDNLAENCINASDYPDMQELLAASDILITDYSSSMWDFALTKKAGFLYTPDKKAYEESGFLCTPIESWPYPAADSNDELAEMICNFEYSDNERKIEEYFNKIGSFEKGDATLQIIQLMKASINKN